MAYKDKETARAAARRFREANPEYGRAQYAKHAEKRRAAKVAAYHSDAGVSRQRQRQRYAHNSDTIKGQQRIYREGHRNSLTEQQRAWREANPEREAIHNAKRILMGQTGVLMRDIPVSVAECKAVELEIKRVAKACLNSDNTSSR